MGWLLELLFESVSEMCSKFIVDMMDVASGMFTEILSCDLDLFEELFGVAGDLYRNAVVPMGVALLLMILVWQLFKSMFGEAGDCFGGPGGAGVPFLFLSVYDFVCQGYCELYPGGCGDAL